MDTLKVILVPVHREGHKFIGLFAIATLVLFAIWQPLGWIGVVLTVWCVYFFRDPERVTPQSDNLIISPADGVICLIEEVDPPEGLDMGSEKRTRVSVFMNVVDCHVNRAPLAGTIKQISYHPGKFLNASLDKASEENERNSYLMDLPDGGDIAFVQIAGLVARRIVWDVREGQSLKAGERFGMIRFGSRVDIYLPHGAKPAVGLGQTMVAGETVIATRDGQGIAQDYRVS